MNKSLSIPVVNLTGPGSQPEDEDFTFLPVPSAINISRSPVFPAQASAQEVQVAKEALRYLAERAADYQGEQVDYPVYTLSEDQRLNSGLLDQILGEGEISAKIAIPAGGEQHIQETVFTGVWRLREYHANQQLAADRLMVCPIPDSVWRTHKLPLDKPRLPPQPPGLMNGAFIAHEICSRLQQTPIEPHVINLTLLPVNESDRAYLRDFLGEGCSAIFSRGYGKCRIVSSRFPGVWRINYFNDRNTLLQDMIEIVQVPEIAVAGMDDIADAHSDINSALEWLEEEALSDDSLTRMECKVCWWIYDPARGDDVWQIPPGTPFSQLPEHWCCPGCETGKEGFMTVEDGDN